MESKEFHYTNEHMVKDLLKLIPYSTRDVILDAGSGKNKVWYNNFEVETGYKFECEVDEGHDFFKWITPVDWIIGNPPYHQSWKFTEHALTIAKKGIAWLVNNQALNSHLTPRRLDLFKEKGFEYTKIHVVADKRWFGRYYFIVLERGKKGIISWERKTYGGECDSSHN